MKPIAFLLLCCILLTGCAQKNSAVSEGLELRKKLSDAENCSFHCTVAVDYGDQIYDFGMECSFDQNRDMSFTVTEPATISGICGVMNATEGSFTFDDKVLLFPLLAEGNISPISAPWILMQSLCGGYLHSGAYYEQGCELIYHDSFQGDTLQIHLYLQGDTPCAAEILSGGRRIASMELKEFRCL